VRELSNIISIRTSVSYLYGLYYYRRQNWQLAEFFFARAAECAPSLASAHFKLGMCRFRQQDWQCALNAMQTAITLDPSRKEWARQRDQSRRHLGLTAPSSLKADSEALVGRISEGEASATLFAKLAANYRRQGRRWQEIDALQDAIARDSSKADWHFLLGEALETMRRYRQAGDAFTEALRLKPSNADWAFRVGFAYERAGFDGPSNPEKAAEFYARAIKADKSKVSAKFGIGVFHEKRGYWREAVEAYERQLKHDPRNAELLYRLGLSHDRCYDWQKAENYLSRSLALDPSHANRHRRLGFVLERQGKNCEAATAYEYAASLGGKDAADRSYRQGVSLAASGAFEAAAQAFLKMKKTPFPLPEDKKKALSTPYLVDLVLRAPLYIEQELTRDARSPELHFARGQAHEQLGDWMAAADAYRDAIARKDDHTWEWYFHLGAVLTKAGRYEEACTAFRETKLIGGAYGWISEEKLAKDKSYRRRAVYAEYYENLLIEENTILYESFHGRSMTCNPLAIFKHLLSREEFADWRHIWVLNDREKVPQEYRALRNVVFITRQSDAYLRALAKVKYLVNNTTFHFEYTRKDGQVYLNTWHGTPIKTLGKHVHGVPFQHGNVARNFLQATHIISPNEHTSNVLLDDYDIRPLFSGALAETGYPRLDATVSLSDAERVALRARLGAKEGEKILLYAPTWRESLGEPKLDAARLLGDLQAMGDDSIRVLFRGHYFTEKLLAGLPLGDIVVPADIDSNTLLAVTDILVTDYSSIAIDFLPRLRPIIYYANDLEEYEAERGMYFPLSDLPGEICQTRDALQVAISNAEARFNPAVHEEAIARFCPMEDGQATKRVVDWVFFGDASGVQVLECDTRPNIILYGGSIMPNGITTSLINLTSHLDHEKHAVTLLVEANAVTGEEERLTQLARLPNDLNVIARVGARLLTLEEDWINTKLETQNSLATPEMWQILQRGYVRELRRMLGSVNADVLINFDGYTRFYHYLLAFAPNSIARRKVLYLHSDMQGEWRERFPYLGGSFQLYDRYDALVSVSAAVKQLNRQNLSDRLCIPEENFTFALNVQNPKHILASSEIPIEEPIDQMLFDAAKPAFVTMGRLSVEKGQETLIRAFAGVAAHASEAKLFILGDGPLRHKLASVIEELRLTDNVYLLGHRTNPFPYLKRADCFVFPSIHEGQGMVLHEAMILGKPIIATDIPTSREILEERPEWLVESSIDGLEAGMLAFVQTPPAPVRFDIDTYQQQALAAFHLNVLGQKGT
jgi:CDP-glycerol glycerophosphotransferase